MNGTRLAATTSSLSLRRIARRVRARKAHAKSRGSAPTLLPYLLIAVATLAIVWFAHHAGAAGELAPWDLSGAGTLTGLAAPPLLLVAILFFIHGDRGVR